MIGISVSALQRIELGTLRVSEKIAGRIAAITDVAPQCLMEPNIRLISRSGRSYTKRDFDLCQARLASPTVRHERDYKKGELRRRIDTLLDAAFSKKRFALVESDLWDALNDIRVVHGLERLTDDRLAADKHDPRWRWDAITRPNGLLLFQEQGMKEYFKRDSTWAADWANLPTGAHAYAIDNHGVVCSTVQEAALQTLFRDARARIVPRVPRKRTPA
jgi:hypothetical protein